MGRKSKKQVSVVAVKVPDIGDFDEVPVIEILVSEGDEVTEEQGLVTLESDKATMDVPSPEAGKVASISVSEGDKVTEGSPLMEIEAGGGDDSGDEDDSEDQDAVSGTEDDEADQAADDEVPDTSDGDGPVDEADEPEAEGDSGPKGPRRSARRSSAAPKAATPWRAARTRRRGCSTPGRASGAWRASSGSTWRR